MLEPLGQHRSQHVPPSKGARSKKRKRPESETAHGPLPAPPLIAADLKVGLNSVTRHLESVAARKGATTDASDQPAPRHLAVVYIPKAQDDMIVAHLPALAAVASAAYVMRPATRLVLLNSNAEKRLAAALGLPRVGAVGIMENGERSAVVDFVREHVPAVDVPWMKEATAAKYLVLNIETSEVKPKTQAEPTSKKKKNDAPK